MGSTLNLTTPLYEIRLEDAADYSLNSADNTTTYDVEYFKCYFNDDRQYPTSKHGVRVFWDDQEIKSAIVCEVGVGTSVHEHAALIAGDDLFICCADYVYCLSIPELELRWRKRMDPACCFGVYHFKESLLIHGELQVSRIDYEGNEIWTFVARDIFVSDDGADCFSIKGDRIVLRDWQGYEYLLDENGKETLNQS